MRGLRGPCRNGRARLLSGSDTAGEIIAKPYRAKSRGAGPPPVREERRGERPRTTKRAYTIRAHRPPSRIYPCCDGSVVYDSVFVVPTKWNSGIRIGARSGGSARKTAAGEEGAWRGARSAGIAGRCPRLAKTQRKRDRERASECARARVYLPTYSLTFVRSRIYTATYTRSVRYAIGRGCVRAYTRAPRENTADFY